MEEKCFKRASVLSFTSQKTIIEYGKKYPQYSSKMKFFPNVFDMEDRGNIPYSLNLKIKVVYTGGLIYTNNRNPEYFFKAINQLKIKYSHIYKDFEFLFAGELDQHNKILFNQMEKEHENIKHLGLLSFNEALDLQEKADILLIIDIPKDSIFFPSKLLDYMLMQRRILALTKQDSTIWEIVQGNLGDCVEHINTHQITQILVNAWNAWKEQDINYFYNKDIDMNFSAKYNAKRLSNLCHRLLIGEDGE